MLLLCESTRRDKVINIFQHTFEQSRIPPELRRALPSQRAGEAAFFDAQFLVVLPEHVHGTHQPMLVGGIELDGVSIAERCNADQRHIVKVDDIVRILLKHLPEMRALQTRISSLLSNKRGEEPKPTLQLVYAHVFMTGEVPLRP